jgi:antitoxin component YwqK of YwqJK toxin-antitoxin module
MEVAGKITGIRRRWYRNGQLFSEAEFQEDVKNGQVREWTETGSMLLSASVVNGQFDGPYQSWWDNGVVKEQGTFKKGVRQPGYRWFNQDGTLQQEL